MTYAVEHVRSDELHAVGEVIEVMHRRLSEALMIDDLARAAHYSKFHFCRLFRKATGITPGRFLSALRLQQSKRLLLTTDLTVSDVSCEVGYNSVGTFTSRFTKSVGLPPSIFRRTGGFVSAPAHRFRGYSAGGTCLEGRLDVPDGYASEPVMLASFPGPIPEGQPERCAVLARPGRWRLNELPPGTWYVGALALGGGKGRPTTPLLEEQARFIALEGPLTVRSGQWARWVDIQLRPVQPTDPPILFAPPRRLTAHTGLERLDSYHALAG